MLQLRALIWSFVREDDGATLVEYALLSILIAMVVAITALTLGQAISNQFCKASTC